MKQVIQTILIEESVAQHPLTHAAIMAQSKAQGFGPKQIVFPDKDTDPINQVLADLTSQLKDDYDAGKHVLLLRKARGDQFKTCPGTKGVVCCNYFVLNYMSGCPLNCSYCYLSAYLTQKALTLQVDLDEVLVKLETLFAENPKRFFRIGTGELADSLALPASDPLTTHLVERFADIPNALIEFKTKSDRIDHLLTLDAKQKSMVSWSISPSPLSQREEHETASIEKRLQCARRVSDAGYLLAFHMDPILYDHPNMRAWEYDYETLIEQVFAAVPPERIAWISVGGLRMLKGLRERMIERFPESRLAYQEMIPGSDGKLRYPKPLRKHMFTFVSDTIKRMGLKHVASSDHVPPVYLCMEAREVWHDVLGSTPDPRGRLQPLFTNALPRQITQNLAL